MYDQVQSEQPSNIKVDCRVFIANCYVYVARRGALSGALVIFLNIIIITTILILLKSKMIQSF